MSRTHHWRFPLSDLLARFPLVERELRAGARRPLFYWLRGLLALLAGFQGYELLDRYVLGPPPPTGLTLAPPIGPTVTGAAMFHQMAWLLFLITLLMALVSADSITRERREGTLGLLLATGLTPQEIVWGKMLSCGLTSFLVILGALPALMFPVLAGGVTGTQAALTGIGLLNSLFVVVAAGLWMSALFRERRYAVPATLGLVAALAFGPEVLGGSCFGRSAAPIFRLFGLAGWMTAARGAVLFNPLFVGWLALTHAIGWVILRQAALTLAKTWQDQPHKLFREPEPAQDWPDRSPAEADTHSPASMAGPARVSWLTDPRPWDADPIRWRVERLGSAEGLIWLAMALNFFAQFGTLGSVYGGRAANPEIWGLLSFLGMGVIVFSGGLLAWVGARFFQDTRRQQDLELLVTSPVGSRSILAGQWRVLRRALRWPVGLVLALALPAGISLLYDFLNGSGGEPWSLLEPFLIAANLALEAVTLCWVGMWFGLRGRNAITAVAATVGLVQLLPLMLAAGLMWAWTWPLAGAVPLPKAQGGTPPVIVALLFFVVKNLGLMVWARLSLRRQLRLGRQAG